MLSTAVFAGPDENGLADALRAEGVDVTVVEGVANRSALEDAGILDADALVLTDVGQATAIPIAKNLNETLRVVAYAEESLPEFVSAQQVLAIDPALLDVATVAEEVAGLDP